MQKKMLRSYKAIKSVHIIRGVVSDVKFYNKEKELSFDELLTTKDSVLLDGQYVVTSGYGKYTKIHLWQLPENLKRDIKRFMVEKYSCECNQILGS